MKKNLLGRLVDKLTEIAAIVLMVLLAGWILYGIIVFSAAVSLGIVSTLDTLL